jgi:hypothetical protein
MKDSVKGTQVEVHATCATSELNNKYKLLKQDVACSLTPKSSFLGGSYLPQWQVHHRSY